MKILEITFDCTIAMPGYSNVKPGIGRAIIDEANGETPEQAWSELNRRAQEWHKTEYPHLYSHPNGKGVAPAPAQENSNGSQADQELEKELQVFSSFKKREDAEFYQKTSPFKYHIKVKEIINSLQYGKK